MYLMVGVLLDPGLKVKNSRFAGIK